jgi:chromate reductase
MNAPEAYIQFKPDLVNDAGNVSVPSTETFLRDYMAEFHRFIARVYTALPRGGRRLVTKPTCRAYGAYPLNPRKE